MTTPDIPTLLARLEKLERVADMAKNLRYARNSHEWRVAWDGLCAALSALDAKEAPHD